MLSRCGRCSIPHDHSIQTLFLSVLTTQRQLYICNKSNTSASRRGHVYRLSIKMIYLFDMVYFMVEFRTVPNRFVGSHPKDTYLRIQGTKQVHFQKLGLQYTGMRNNVTKNWTTSMKLVEYQALSELYNLECLFIQSLHLRRKWMNAAPDLTISV